MRRVFLATCVVLGLHPLAALAQSQLTLDPPLSQVFPLDMKADGMRVRYPVLINDHTIVRPDSQLRFIYLDTSSRAGGDDDAVHAHFINGPHGTLTHNDNGSTGHGENAWGKGDANTDAGIFDVKRDDGKASKTELQGEVWMQQGLFTDALDHATDQGTTLVYAGPAQKRPSTAAFDLPGGMLLAEVDGHVRVLGLTQDSRAFVGGIRPGDEIRSFNSGTTVASLDDFIRAYAATRRQARLSGNSSYSIEVWRPGDGQMISIQIAAPPSIPSFL